MERRNYETVFLRDEIAKCEELEELKERIFPLIASQKNQWEEKMREILTESGLSKSSFAEQCGVSRISVNKWCKGSIPKSRETFLRIGMAAGYDRIRMDQLLQRYGQYPALYAKSLEDSICIFVLKHYRGPEILKKYNSILDRIKERIRDCRAEDEKDGNTVWIEERISCIANEIELEQFVEDNASVFMTAYHRFYAYVKMNIIANYTGFAGSVFELAESQNWSSSLRQCVSAIRQKKWYPTRNKIISLGLHLSMDHDQIDEMLKLAHMEPLCAKNLFESVIMYILDDASLNNMLDSDSDYYDPDALCRYARQVLKTLNIPEIEEFITELPEMDDE